MTRTGARPSFGGFQTTEPRRAIPCGSPLHSSACWTSPASPSLTSTSAPTRWWSPWRCAAATWCAPSATTRPGPATTPARWPRRGATSICAPGAWRCGPICAGSAARSTTSAPRACPSPGPDPASPGTSRIWWAGWPPPWTRPPSSDWCASTGPQSGASSSG